MSTYLPLRRDGTRCVGRRAEVQLVFKLCRRHGWGSPIPEDDLVNLALHSSDQGRGRTLVGDLVSEPYIGFRSSSGYFVRNDPDSQAYAAYRLQSTCGYTKLQIEGTLSRFAQAGGFDAYDDREAELLADLPDW